jgi:phosphatidylserine decarboxylase
MIKLAPEGYPFISGALALTVLVFIFVPVATVIPLALTAFMVYFFRDPERSIPEGKDLFVAPADGKVIVIREVREERYLHADVKQVSIFMSPLNVHVNRAPCGGRVRRSGITKAASLPRIKMRHRSETRTLKWCSKLHTAIYW